jgi:hypothetical protein
LRSRHHSCEERKLAQFFPITIDIQLSLSNRLVPVMYDSRSWLNINKIEIRNFKSIGDNRKRQCTAVEPD